VAGVPVADFHVSGSLRRGGLALLGFYLLVSALKIASAEAQEIVTVATRPEVTQAFFLARVPQDAKAVALLFPGSAGLIKLRSEQQRIKFNSGNFLVRSRAEFVNRGVVTTIMDAPSDQQSRGMSDEFRLGSDHANDIEAVLRKLRERFPALPIFVVGTSRGTISAASLAARLGQRIAGAVITSTMFRRTGRKSPEPGPGLSGFDFVSIKVPLLLVHHVGDQCYVTPYSDAAKFSDRYPLITVFGGAPPRSGPCDAHSPHGFLGKESETVEEIVNWMLKKPFKERVE
jgi:hypothetical protein